MRKLFIVFLVFISCAISTQAQGPGGLGRFKIGQTTANIIDSLKNENNLKEAPQITSNQVATKLPYSRFAMLELIIDTVSFDNTNPNLLPVNGVRVFVISLYEVAGMELHWLYLTFYKDTLVKISARHDETVYNIQDAFEKKFGKGAYKLTRTKSSCAGAEDESTETELWHNGSIETNIYDRIFYNSACVKTLESLFTCCKKSVFDALSTLQKSELIKLNKRKQMKEKQKLSDF